MFRRMKPFFLIAVLLALPFPAGADETVDFVREVQPILQKHCLKCHGPEEQNGGLRYVWLHQSDFLYLLHCCST